MFTHQIHEDENLLQMYRKHEITLVPKVLQVFILIFVPWYLGLRYDYIFSSPGHTRIFIAWTLLVAFYAMHIFLVWAINVYIITSKRLLHIQHSSIFRKTVIETPLDRVLNVSFKTTGLFSTIFRYGDVLVQVVGLEQPIVLKQIPNPSQVKDFIWSLHHGFGGDQKITYTKPEIAPLDKHIPYAPQHLPAKVIRKNKDVKIL